MPPPCSAVIHVQLPFLKQNDPQNMTTQNNHNEKPMIILFANYIFVFRSGNTTSCFKTVQILAERVFINSLLNTFQRRTKQEVEKINEIYLSLIFKGTLTFIQVFDFLFK